MLRLLLLISLGVVHGQLPFLPKGFPKDLALDSEAKSDALNLHDGDGASLSVAAPMAIDCTVRGTDFLTTLLQKGACSHAISMRGRPMPTSAPEAF